MRSACTLLLFLISAAARAELTVFAGVEYFNWQEATTPSVQETGPLLAGGLIWIQDKERACSSAIEARSISDKLTTTAQTFSQRLRTSNTLVY